jgi:predicted metal-dependent peptidase
MKDLVDDASRKLKGAQLRIRGDHPFFGTLALYAEFVVSDRIQTASTDGRKIWFNPNFIRKLDRKALCGLFVHELLHVALRHTGRRLQRDPHIWNIAADIVVNGMIRSDTDYSLPSGGVEMVKLSHLSVDDVYEQLLSGRYKLPDISLFDLEIGESGSESGEGSSSGSLLIRSVAELDRHWSSALQQAAAVARRMGRGFGSKGLGSVREFDQVQNAPLIWIDLLWNYMVTTPYDFGGFDRRFLHKKIYLEESVEEVVHVWVCIDTSASIGRDELGAFMGEIQCILDSYPQIQGTLFFADAELYGPHEFSKDTPMPKARGGGGTAFEPFFDWVAQQERGGTQPLSIYFTDGYGSFPLAPPESPVLWVVISGGLESTGFPFGEVARMVTSPSPR